jgi:hypothetical protein
MIVFHKLKSQKVRVLFLSLMNTHNYARATKLLTYSKLQHNFESNIDIQKSAGFVELIHAMFEELT